MKLDPDLIRQTLIVIEEKSDGVTPVFLTPDHFPDDEKPDPAAFNYHLDRMDDAGLILTGPRRRGLRLTADAPRLAVKGLTWDGHQFLDSIRDSGMWGKVKKTAVDTAGSLSMRALQLAATSVIENAFSK